MGKAFTSSPLFWLCKMLIPAKVLDRHQYEATCAQSLSICQNQHCCTQSSRTLKFYFGKVLWVFFFFLVRVPSFYCFQFEVNVFSTVCILPVWLFLNSSGNPGKTKAHMLDTEEKRWLQALGGPLASTVSFSPGVLRRGQGSEVGQCSSSVSSCLKFHTWNPKAVEILSSLAS